jgi:pimeloyl-ACP methyl ester carboxylesterase
LLNYAGQAFLAKDTPARRRDRQDIKKGIMRPTPLLMIHGLLGSIDYFAPRNYLTGLDVYTPDRIGYGANEAAAPAAAIDLHMQADAIAQIIRDRIGAPTWLLGHSVGGVVAMLVADRVPELVAGLISVEGNFTLNDAVWCASIAVTAPESWEKQYRVMVADPAGFLARGEIASSAERLAWAKAILENQNAAAVHATATSVIKETGAPAYLKLVRRVVERTPLYLLSGQRSTSGWDVPDWVRAAARREVVMPDTGHMMMLEDPAGFCRSVRELIDGSAVGTSDAASAAQA